MSSKIVFIITLTSLIISGTITGLTRRVSRLNFKIIFFSLFFTIELLFLYGTFEPKAPVFGQPFWRGPKNLRAISITFDDGPNEPYTSQILEILRKFNVKATFFVVGENVEIFQATLRKEIEEGHEIGIHTYNHNVLPLRSPRYIREQIQKTSNLIEKTANVHPLLFRAPHGWRNPWVNLIAREEGLTTVAWTHEVFDIYHPGAEVITQRALKGLENGCILLLHDGRSTRHKVDSSQLVEALPLILAEAQRKGYRFLTVSEMMKEDKMSRNSILILPKVCSNRKHFQIRNINEIRLGD